MSQSQPRNGGSDTPDRQERLELYNGEFEPSVIPATGFQDKVEPVDETIESMADAAATAHKNDDTATAEAHDMNRHTRIEDQEDGSGDEDQERDQDKGVIVNAQDMTSDLLPKKKRKKKSRKPQSKRGLDKPTGFEDNYADAPLTPDQAIELKELYSPDISFVERVLTAIQRFERTRKLTPERRDVFYKYLAYGGIDVGPNMFQGQQDTQNMSKEELATALAQANISEDTKASILDPKCEPKHPEVEMLGPSKTLLPDHAVKYTVDFLATMKAFLSRRASVMYTFDTRDQVGIVTRTLERFMDYLLQQDACPEYYQEVLATRNLCREAMLEMWNCAEAQRWLPGDFNVACSTLFGGKYSKFYDGQTHWNDLKPGENVFVGFTPEKATQIVGFAIAGAAAEDVYASYYDIYSSEGTFEVVETISDHGFEITKIEKATLECLDLYKNNTTEYIAVGRVHAKFWFNPDTPPDDLTPEERKSTVQGLPESVSSEYVFFVESATILPFLAIGQKIEATIHKLNCGVWFFDEVFRVCPTFDTWIENEMMLGWKEPKPLKGSLESNSIDAQLQEE